MECTKYKSEKTKQKLAMWCFGLFAIFLILVWIIVIISVGKRDKKLDIAEKECREKWWYIETFYKNPDIICWDKEWMQVYFRRYTNQFPTQ